MVDKINSQSNIQSMLQTLRSYQSQAAGGMDDDGNKVGSLNGLSGSKSTEGPSGFSDLVRQTVNKVNENQQASNKLATAFEMGTGGVDLTDVMIASQKASVSFQAMTQVRNRLVQAYQDIMQMPV